MKLISARISCVLVALVAVFGISERAWAQTFTASPTSLAFGTQAVGSTSAAKTVSVKNSAATPLTFSLNVTGDYSATSVCAGTVNPGATCIVSATFTPTALGSRPGTLQIVDAGNAANLRTIVLSGTGVTATTSSPTSLAFGNVAQNAISAAKTFKLTNNQDVPLTSITLSSSNPAYSTTGCPATLPARTFCNALVVFAPLAAPGTAENATLTISHSAGNSPQVVTLTGTSVAPFSLSTAALNFGSVTQGAAKSLNVTLKNNQAVPLGGLAFSVAAPFSATGCAGSIAPGATCVILVSFSPTVTNLGPFTQILTVSSSDPSASNTPQVALSATATVGVAVTPNPLDFGNITVAATSAGKTITIKNSRPVPLTFGSPLISVTGPQASEFAQTATTCGPTLAAGTSCKVTLTFHPTVGGSRTATLAVNDDAPGNPQVIGLRGNATTPMTITPGAVSFGNVAVGLVSAGKLLTLKNNQSVPVALSSFTTGSTEFLVQDTATTTTTCGATLAPGGICTISLVLIPEIGGARSGSLTIANNTIASPRVVKMTGTGIKAVTASVTSLTFAGQKVGTTSLSKPITITNHQTVPAPLGTVLTGDFASTDACTGTVPALSTCVVSVTFTPTTTGPRGGTAVFTNPGSATPLSVGLSGTGNTANPPAAVSNVAPGAGAIGTLVTGVIVTGNGYTNFAMTSTVSFGAGVTVKNLRNVSANSLTVDLDISGVAVPGARNVSVVTPIAGSPNQTATLTSGFTVTATSSSSSIALTPAFGLQGQTLDVAIAGTNTHFAPGVTLANFGSGVFVNGPVNVIDATHAIANVTVSPTTTLGWRTVTVLTGGEFATLTAGINGPGFLVLDANAAITNVNPSSAQQGAPPFTVTVTGSNTHFLQNATQLSLGPGINVGNVQVLTPALLTAQIAVTGGATTGLRDVTATTGGEVATATGAFNVTPSAVAPYLQGVSPTTGHQGEHFTMSIVGVNTQFTSGTPTLNLGSNVATSLTVVDDTHISAAVDVSLIADVSGRDAILTATASGNPTDFHFSFAVLPSPAEIVSVVPGSGPQGSELDVEVTGSNTHWDQDTLYAWFPPSPYCAVPFIQLITVNSPTSATLHVAIPAGGCVGSLTFRMATGGEMLDATFGVYRHTPSLALSPSTGMIGTALPLPAAPNAITVNFIGEFTHFGDGAAPNGPTTAVIDGAKVAITNFTVLTPTSATATFVIQPDAIVGACAPIRTAGCHLVTLTTPTGGADEIVTADFQVTSSPAILTSIVPFHLAPGTTATLQIFGSYTHFVSGVTTVGFGPNISTSGLVVVSPTQLTVNVTVGSTAALGWRNAYVNTVAQGVVDEQLTIGFRVDGPVTPAITSVNPTTGQQGQSLTVDLTGVHTNFNAGSQLILGAGITVTQFTATSATTATAVVNIAATAPVGPNSVVVITPLAGGQQEIVSALAFSVTRGPQQILTVSPATAAQNQVRTVSLVGQGTHWLQGGTSASFGPGTVVTQLTIADATHASAQIVILSTAPLGFHTVAMQSSGEYVELAQGLNVTQGTPVILNTNPNAGDQSTTFSVQVLGQNTHWIQGYTAATYGTGVTVDSINVIDSTSAVLMVSVDPLAYPGYSPGCHGLTMTTIAPSLPLQGIAAVNEQVSLTNQLCVRPGAAQLIGVTPAISDQSTTLTVVVTGLNTHFVDGLTTAAFGAGINVTAVDVTSPTSATLALAVTTNATYGFHTVTLRTLGETASMQYAFVVGPNTPTLNAASPVSGQQAQQNITVRLFGQYTHWNANTTVTFGPGITIDSVTIVNPETLDVVIDVAQFASPGPRTVTVTTGGEIVSNGSIFTVLPGGAIISAVAPDNGNQGQDILLTVTGLNTDWQQGLTQFSISGAGGDIKINYVLIDSPTSAQASITIAPTASLGARSVYMTTTNQTLVAANAFIVTGGIPALASVSPGSGQVGQTAINVQIAGLYTKWQTDTPGKGLPTVDFGPGVTVTGYTVNSDTSITAVIDIDVAAGLGGRVVGVRQGLQLLTGSFQVLANVPPTPFIGYMSPTAGLRGQTLDLTFSGVYTHWNPTTTLLIGDPGTSGITINAFQVTSPTSAIANITIGNGAPFQSNQVDIATGTELVQASFAVVNVVPVLTIVDPASGMQTGALTVNVIGQHTAFDATTTFDFGAGILVGTPTVLGPTVAQVPLTIAFNAPLGSHGVTATTNGVPVSGAGFYVTPSQAVITAVSPNAAKQQDILMVSVTGQNTHWSQGSTTFSFGGGIGITSTTVIDATHADVTISIPALEALGGHTVTAQTGGEFASMPNAFIVQPGTSLVLSSGPTSGQQQQGITLTILGQFTQWVNGTTTVTAGPDVTINSATVTSPTAITAIGVVGWQAIPGCRTITVTTGGQVLTLPCGLVVTTGPAAVAQVAPNQVGQTVTTDIVVTGTNTHFAAGLTLANFGAGVTANTVTVNSLTSATVNITTAANAPAGFRNVVMSTLGEAAVGLDVLLIQQTTPTLQFVAPASVAQGATQDVTVTGSLTNFNLTTTFDFGPGVSVNSVTPMSPVQAKVNITVSPVAARTTRTVSSTTTGVAAQGANLFTVIAGPAYVSAVGPQEGPQNRNGLQVGISGNATHFTAAAPSVNLGPGVTVTNVQVSSDTLLTATVNISPSAPVQLNDVSVITLGELATLPGGFRVVAGVPTIITATPTTARQNETTDVSITGLYTNFAVGTTTASFGAGVTINSVAVTNATHATVNVTVQPGAALGSRTITMTTGAQTADGVGAFTVLAGQPQLVSVSPNTGAQSSTQSVTITGLFTTFQAGVSQVAFSGGGVTAGVVTVNGPTQIQVPVTVAAGSAADARTVTVTTGGEVVSLVGSFTVLPGLPAVTVIAPNVGVPNSTVNVSISGEFTHFANGTTSARFGPGISVNGGAAGGFGFLTVTSATTATATLTIDPAAVVGARDVRVQTGGEMLDVNNGFTVQTASPTPPTVVGYSPPTGAVDVPINTALTIQFSAPLDRTTVSSANIRLTDGTTQGACWANYSTTTPGTVDVDASGRIVTFTPASVLFVGRTYHVCVNYGQQGTPQELKDPSGNQLAAFVSAFSTGFGPDTTGPAFIAASVADGDVTVPTNAPVMLRFTRSINPATVEAGLSVTAGGADVPGTMSYTGDYKQLTFTPSSPFAPATAYVLNYTAALTDSVGNPLTNPGTVAFTTAGGPDGTYPTVVSYTPAYGSVSGVSPTIRVTFSEPVNPVRVEYFTLQDTVTGWIVPGTSYTVSADRRTVTLALPRPLNPGNTFYYTVYVYDRVGQATVANVYFATSGTPDVTAPAVLSVSPPDTAGNVPVNARIQVLFSEPLDATALPVISLSPPVTGTSAWSSNFNVLTFTPAVSLATATPYAVSVTSPRDGSGNVGGPAGWSFTTSASAVADTSNGAITMTPSHGATNVPVTTPIVLTLSKPVNPASVNADSFRVYDAVLGQTLSGTLTVGADFKSVTFTPKSPYVGGHAVQLYASYFYSLLDQAGNPFSYLYAGTFTAAPTVDSTAPTVLSVTPFDGATGIGPSNPVTVTFSEPMKSSTLNGHIALFEGSTLRMPSFSVSPDATSITFAFTMAHGATFTVVVDPTVTDMSGNALGTQFTSTFTTAPRPVTTRPEVRVFRPGGGATGVEPNRPVVFMLSQPIDPTTVAAALHVSQNGTLMTGTTTVTAGDRVVTFTPAAPYALGTLIQVWFTSAATDTLGNTLFDYQTSFTVRPNMTAVAPSLVETVPTYAQANLPLNTVIDFRFNKSINPASVTAGDYYLTNCANSAVSAAISFLDNNRVLRLTPFSPLAPGACYYVTHTAALKDVDGLGMGGNQIYFNTGTASDSTPPAVVYMAPGSGATNIGVNAAIRVTFSEQVSVATLGETTVTLSQAGTPIPYLKSYVVNGDGTSTMTLTPAAALPASSAVTVGVNSGVTDRSGNGATPFSATFTTAAAPDFTHASVISSTVNNGDTGVPVNSVFTLTFDRPMDTRTLTSGTFYLYDSILGYLPTTLSFSPDQTQVTLAPASLLAVNRSYQLQTCSALDLTGIDENCFSAGFITATQAPVGGPVVLVTSPFDEQLNVPTNFRPGVRFDRSISRSSVAGVTFTLGGAPVAFTPAFSAGDTVMILVPAAPLQSNSSYVLTFSGVKDVGGTPMSAPVTVSFSTGPSIDLQTPTLLQSSLPPSNAFTGTTPIIRWQLSEPIDRLRTSGGTLLNVASGQYIPGITFAFSPGWTTIRMIYPGPLDPVTLYQACSTELVDLAGNDLGQSCQYFSTGTGVNTAPLTVTDVAPSPGASAIPLNATIAVRLSNAIDPTSLTGPAITLVPATAGSIQYSSDRRVVTFVPAASLSAAAGYTVNVTGFSDFDGNAVAAFSSGFTTSGAVDTTPGSISLTSPAPGAIGVAVNSTITLTLSEPVNPLRIVDDTFYVGTDSARLSGTISVGAGGTTLTFTPTAPLPPSQTIHIYASYFAQLFDWPGNGFNYLYNATFTTAATADVIPPVVLSVSPIDGTPNVGPFTTVTLQFSESLDPGTITGANFALFQGFTNLGANVQHSPDNRTVTLTRSPLPYGAPLTLVVSTGVTDIVGNPLAAPFGSTFTVLPASLAGAASITQMRPAPGATNVPVTSVITLYANHPISASSLNGALAVAQNGVLVAGTTVVDTDGRSVVFTPAVPFAASAFVQVFVSGAATDTAGNAFSTYSASFTTQADLTGATLQLTSTAPPYGSSAVPTNVVVDLQFNKAVLPADITSANFFMRDCGGLSVPTTLSQPWPSVVRLTPNALLAPSSGCSYFYYFVSASVHAADGRPIQSSYDYYYFYIGTAADTVAPSVTNVTPANGATAIGDNATMRIQFSELMDEISINASTLTLMKGGTPIPFSMSIGTLGAGTQVTVTPQAPLPDSSTITLSLGAGMSDRAAQPIVPMSVSFQTGVGPDVASPQVVYRSPEGGQNAVPLNTRTLTFVYNEPLDPLSLVNTTYFYNYNLGAYLPITTTLSADGKTVTLTLAADLTPGHSFVGCLNSARDLTGNESGGYCLSFTSGSSTSVTPPQVIGTTPVPGATGAARNTLIEATFDRQIDGTSLGQITLSKGGVPVPFTIVWRQYSFLPFRTIRLIPAAVLDQNTTYSVVVTGVKDLAGNVMAGPYPFSFTTGLNPLLQQTTSITSATVDVGGVATQLTDGQNVSSVSPGTALQVLFSKPVAVGSVISGGAEVYALNTGVPIAVSVTMSADGRTATLTPAAPLATSTQYQLRINYNYAVFDQAGFQVTNYRSSMNFTTGLDVIDFEDQPDSIANGTPFPSPYHGVTWTNWLHASPYNLSIFVPNGKNAVYPAVDGAKMTFTDRVFVGAKFSRWAGGPGSIYFELYYHGALVWTSGLVPAAQGQLTFLPSGYSGLVDEVRLRSLGSSMTPQGGTWIMDDVTFGG